jgi:hypothetical protein
VGARLGPRRPTLSSVTRGLTPRRSLLLLAVLLGALWTVQALGGHGEGRDAATLRRVAQVFNDDYAANRDGAVYDRFDAASRAVISRGAYVARHAECPTNPGRATVESASPVGGGWWVVRYQIAGVSLTDYWRYRSGRWQFDLVRSNPDAARLYRMSAAAYLRAMGC